MSRSNSARLALVAVLAAASLVMGGCDPKLIAADDGAGAGTGGNDEVQLTVSEEASATGAVIALHMDILRSGLSLAAEFDSVSASPLPRSIFTTECITLTELDPVEPSWDLSLTGCVDGRGTTYRGGGMFESEAAIDGYTFWPYSDAADMILAENTGNTSLNHTYEQGTFWYTFNRGAGGVVIGVEVANYLRHGLLTEVATFSYDGVEYTGGVGATGEWPNAAGIVHVSWDSVGLFDIEFSGGSTASFTIQGIDYVVNMTTGDVNLAANLE